MEKITRQFLLKLKDFCQPSVLRLATVVFFIMTALFAQTETGFDRNEFNKYRNALDWKKTFEYCQKYAGMNDGEAQSELSVLYACGRGTPVDYQSAVSWRLKAAANNYNQAKLNLAICYWYGMDVEINEAECEKYLHQIDEALKNHPEPGGKLYFNLGNSLLQGVGGRKDAVLADQYFKTALEKFRHNSGDEESLYYQTLAHIFGYGTPQNIDGALQNILILEKRNSLYATALYQTLGSIYQTGFRQIADNPELSNRYYKKAFAGMKLAADSGSANDMFQVGMCYLKGNGTTANKAKALYYFQQSAECGDRIAQLLMGQECFNLDVKNAEKWFILAASNGDKHANLQLGDLYFQDGRIPPDYQKAVQYYEIYLKRNNPKSYNRSLIGDVQWKLGEIYAKGGYGVEKSEEKSRRWYEKAAANGSKKAVKNLKSFNKE